MQIRVGGRTWLRQRSRPFNNTAIPRLSLRAGACRRVVAAGAATSDDARGCDRLWVDRLIAVDCYRTAASERYVRLRVVVVG